MYTGLPNDPNTLSQSEKVLGNFFAAKDVIDRNPGGNKKKWPLVVAGVLLAFVISLLAAVLIITSGGVDMNHQAAQTGSVSSEEAPAPQAGMVL